MPLLPPEPFVYPPTLLTEPSAPQTDERWWVLHTKARAEKSVARWARRYSLSYFLPLYSKTWTKSKRRFTSVNPLFTGYVFLHGDCSAKTKLVETNLLARAIPVVNQARMHDELQQVYQLITSGAPLTPEERLEKGDPVDILHGPFAGFKGTVVTRGNQTRLIVEVQFLHQGVSVEIENWMIAPHKATATDQPAKTAAHRSNRYQTVGVS